jgi:NADPH2:quinone reductase
VHSAGGETEGIGWCRHVQTCIFESSLQIAAEHGVDYPDNYTKEAIREWVKALGGADVVYDPVGSAVFDASLRCIN